MQVFMFKTIIKEAWQYKKIIGVLVLALALLGGAFGFFQSKNLPKTAEGENIAKYEQGLKGYDDALAAAMKNLKTSEEQLKKQQEYVDNHPYMKIDPQKQQWGELSFKVDAPMRMGDVIQSYHNFVNRSWLAHAIAPKFPDEPENYIKEAGMWSGNNGNMWTVTVIRKDAETIKKLLPLMKEAIVNYKKDVKFEHELTLVKEVSYVRADQGTLKNQNAHRDTLRRFTNDVRVYNTQIADIQKQRDNYIRVYKPRKYELRSPGKAAGRFAALGAALGLILPLVFFALKNTMSTRVKTIDELLMLGLPVLSIYNGKEYQPVLERTLAELEMICVKKEIKTLFLGSLASNGITQAVIDDYKKSLQTVDVSLIIADDIANNVEQVRQLAKCEANLVLVKLGETAYKDVQNYLKLCKKLDVDVWGFIVIA